MTFAATGGFGGAEGDTDVGIYDIQGRLIRTVVSGRFAPGYHTATWDGRDQQGTLAASGVYFLRLESAGLTRSIKLPVVR